MDYEKKKLGNKFPSNETMLDMFKTIMQYIKGECKEETGYDSNGNRCVAISMTERARQYYSWGAHNFKAIVSNDGCCYGLQFNVSGFLHRGRVRIYYNIATDYFDVELLKARKEEMVWGCADLDFMQLHNVLHQHIERKDDPEV